jgi:hypothetical protein
VTVSFLNKQYEISSNIGSSAINQSVFETSYQEYSTNDLTKFQKKYGLTVQSAQDKNGYEVADCSDVDYCTEGNLDVQYIMVSGAVYVLSTELNACHDCDAYCRALRKRRPLSTGIPAVMIRS